MSPSHAQEESGLVKTVKGMLVVWNEPGNYYTIEIIGKDVSPAQQQLWFNVDGRFFQIVTARIADFAADFREKKLDDAAVLAAHRKWESDYIAETLQKKLDVKEEPVKLQNGKAALYWTYEMPKVSDKQTARKQFYLAIVKGAMFSS